MFTLLFGIGVGYTICYIQTRFGSALKVAKEKFEKKIETELKK